MLVSFSRPELSTNIGPQNSYNPVTDKPVTIANSALRFLITSFSLATGEYFFGKTIEIKKVRM